MAGKIERFNVGIYERVDDLCENCKYAKTAYLLLARINHPVQHIGVMCLSCERIWKIGDDT